MLAPLTVLCEVLGFTLLLSALRAPLWKTLGASGSGQVLVWPAYGLVILVLAGLVNRLGRGDSLRALGFRYHAGFRGDVWAGVVAYAVLNVVALPFEMAALADRARLNEPIMRQLGLSSTAQIIAVGGALALLMGFLTGAFHEEILFRGYYQGTGSKRLSPGAGFFIALLPFTLGHYASHPEWSMAQVIATVLPGVALGLLYGATGSLAAVMTLHTLSNWIGAYPVLVLVASHNRSTALLTAGATAAAFLALIWIRRKREIRVFAQATANIFRISPGSSLVAGLLIGGVLLAIWPYRPDGSWAGLGGTFLIGIALAANQLLRMRGSTASSGSKERMDLPG
jgi:membrane protease YdiL (CAAX protease family)